MRKFEIAFVPTKEKFISGYIKMFSKFKKDIECVYIPDYPEDIGTYYFNNYEYMNQILHVKENFDIEILIHNDCNEEKIKTYYDNNIKRFMINNDELARKLKDKYKDIILTLSINRHLSHKELFELDLSCYDYIMLNCRYNRRLSLLKTLPKKYKYVLLLNSDCDYNGERDWQINKFNPKIFRNLFGDKDISSYLFPNDLKYFDKYVHHYILQGKERINDENKEDFFSTHMLGYFNREQSYYNLQ